MSETVQANIRVPAEARDVLTRIGAKLREDAGFADLLEALLDDDSTPTGLSLSERITRIETHLGIDTPQGGATETPPLATGEGRGRRLTSQGEIEVERRIEAGESDVTIAKALDVSTNTIKARRQKIGDRLL